MRRLIAVFAATIAMIPVDGHAQDRAAAPLIDGLATCLRLAADAQRLACLDTAAKMLVDASARGEVAIVAREAIRKTRRSLFGLSLDPDDALVGKDTPTERIEQLDTTIRAASREPNDRWGLALAEGGHWLTTEPWFGDADPRPGMAVSVRRGSLGSYVLRGTGLRPVKVRRVN